MLTALLLLRLQDGITVLIKASANHLLLPLQAPEVLFTHHDSLGEHMLQNPKCMILRTQFSQNF